jgi:hypothetical protein
VPDFGTDRQERFRAALGFMQGMADHCRQVEASFSEMIQRQDAALARAHALAAGLVAILDA